MTKLDEIDFSFLERPTAGGAAQGAGESSAIDLHSLADLNFTDLYLTVDDASEAFYRIGPNGENKFGLQPVPQGFTEHMDTIRSQLSKKVSDGSGVIDFGTLRLRFETAVMADNRRRAAIRRIPIDVPRLTDLSMAPEAVKALRSWVNERGLVLIGGATGNGKTTTAVAMLHDYMTARPGVAVTIEDPPEYDLQGNLGTGGHCFQIEVRADSEWETAINTVLRWRPRYVMIGEIRCPEAAAQALRASTSGHLVIATVHGGALDEAVDTVLRLAETGIGDGAKRLLAHNIVGVVRQNLGRHGPDIDYINLRRGATTETAQMARKAILEGNLSTLRKYETQFPAKAS